MNTDGIRPEPVAQDLAAILDLPSIQRMMDDLYKTTGVGFTIIDLKGNILVGTGWQDICTDFHRKNSASCANCFESDLILTQGVKRGEFKTYKCKNGMWDIVTPLYISEQHVANVFTGQFFFDDEKPDVESFSRQADQFGFDRKPYLQALKRAPRHSREKVNRLMDFFTRFSTMISQFGYSNLQLAKAAADQKQVAQELHYAKEDLATQNEELRITEEELRNQNEELRAAEEQTQAQNEELHVASDELQSSRDRYRDLYDFAPIAFFTIDENNTITDANISAGQMLSLPKNILTNRNITDFLDETSIYHFSRIRTLALSTKKRQTIEARVEIGARKIDAWIVVSPDEDGRHLRVAFEDITERKKAQEAIKAAAEEWQATFDSITDVIMLLDPEHRIIRANRAFSDVFKIPVSETVGRHCFEIVHGTEGPPLFCPHVKTMKCASKACEEFLEPKLGIYVEATTLAIIDTRGKCTGSIHIVKNIHDRKLAEMEREKLLRQVQDQRLLLESTLNQLPTGVAIRDNTGKLILSNGQLERIFGEPPGLMTTFDLSRAFHKDGRPYKAEEWPMNRTVSSGEPVNNEEMDIVRADGSRATVLVSTAPIRDDKGEVLSNVGVFRDITDRKQIEKELESMARFPKENPNPVLRVDNECTLIFANDAAAYVLNCWDTRIGEKVPEHICLAIDKSASSGQDQTVDSVCGDRIFSMVFTPVGEFGYVNIYGRDITGRKKAEESLFELNATLEHRVEQRTLELETAYNDLSEQLKLRALAEDSLRSLSSRLLSIQEDERRIIARELHDQTGQSLTVLKLMVGRADRLAPEEMKPILKDTGNLIAEIIKQVRSLSLSLRPGILDDLGLVPAMEWLFKQLQSQADLQIHFEHDAISGLPSDTNTVIYRITQEALTNIMRHAGVKEAWVQLLSQDGKLRLKIEDHGRGFETSASSASTGLSAMRERAALLEGTCVIESTPGKGTSVIIELPIKPIK